MTERASAAGDPPDVDASAVAPVVGERSFQISQAHAKNVTDATPASHASRAGPGGLRAVAFGAVGACGLGGLIGAGVMALRLSALPGAALTCLRQPPAEGAPGR
jgi:hypothetical protein